MLVPAHIEDGHSEGSLAPALGVDLLEVTEPADQLLAGDGLPIRVFVSLTNQSQLISQEVSIRSEPSNAAHLQDFNINNQIYINKAKCPPPLPSYPIISF